MKEKIHEGRCKFTPKGSICMSTATELIQSLTANDIKRLAGLDDVKVLKGRENFETLCKFAEKYCKAGKERQMALDQINQAELFYQTDYVGHLERESSHKCDCLTCGFHNTGTSPFS
jgi:hypothetical protein